MPEWGQNLTPTENVGRGFILRSTLPAQWVVSSRVKAVQEESLTLEYGER
jgi:hypothetical protein